LKNRVLIIANQEPDCAPNQRFRFEQYLSFLKEHGYLCEVSPLLSCDEARLLYDKGHYFRKAMLIRRSYLQRKKDLKRMSDYDFVYISREALMTGSFFFEKKLSQLKKPFIFDFDDAIWKIDVSPANRHFSWLKNPAKTSGIIKLADIVIAGNKYLADYARQFNQNTIVIPTTVETGRFKKTHSRNPSEKIIIGWSGSNTTIAHLKTILPVLKIIKDKYGDKVDFKVIGDEKFSCLSPGIKGERWTSADEVTKMNEFDIGIMPLPDNEWTKGKCGLKGLTYMACEIPSVMSPVGVNNEIIRHGKNGFLAASDEEWIEVLGSLIESPELRENIGKAGRQTVIDNYSVESNKQKYLDCFGEILKLK
jgi:glycosyltransferase involved in cell wall biosynthesis